MQIEVGEILDGRVSGITGFGAFVTLPDGRSGLVHISEVADTYVRDIREYLTEGQEVKVKVMNLSPDGKIGLSIRRAAPTAEQQERRGERRPSGAARPASRPAAENAGSQYVPETSGNRNFEDKLKQFMKESDGKMSGNRLFQQQKRGQRRRK